MATFKFDFTQPYHCLKSQVGQLQRASLYCFDTPSLIWRIISAMDNKLNLKDLGQSTIALVGWECTAATNSKPQQSWFSRLFSKPKIEPATKTDCSWLCTTNNIPQAVIYVCETTDRSSLGKLNIDLTRLWCESGLELKGIVMTKNPPTKDFEDTCQSKNICVLTIESLTLAASSSEENEELRNKILNTNGRFVPV